VSEFDEGVGVFERTTLHVSSPLNNLCTKPAVAARGGTARRQRSARYRPLRSRESAAAQQGMLACSSGYLSVAKILGAAHLSTHFLFRGSRG
jgi:hypothetical protein